MGFFFSLERFFLNSRKFFTHKNIKIKIKIFRKKSAGFSTNFKNYGW